MASAAGPEAARPELLRKPFASIDQREKLLRRVRTAFDAPYSEEHREAFNKTYADVAKDCGVSFDTDGQFLHPDGSAMSDEEIANEVDCFEVW